MGNYTGGESPLHSPTDLFVIYWIQGTAIYLTTSLLYWIRVSLSVPFFTGYGSVCQFPSLLDTGQFVSSLLYWIPHTAHTGE
jgi:hypothetical protein